MHTTTRPTTPPDGIGRPRTTRPSLRCDTPLLRALDAEWDLMASRPSVVRATRPWPDVLRAAGRGRGREALRRVVERARSLDDIVDATQRADRRRHASGGAHDADDLLAALVVVSRSEQLAGRLLVQRLIPGVVVAARRWSDGPHDDAIDRAIATIWTSLAAYDVDRRPNHIAAALVHDVVWATFRREARRRSSTEIAAPPLSFGELTETPHCDPMVELAVTIRAAEHAGVERVHLDLVRDLAATGSTAVLADRHGVTPRTIRNRRHVALRRIAHAIAA